VSRRTRRPRILIADDHQLVVEGLQRLLEGAYEVVGTADNGRALLAAAERLKPDVILVDVSMPLLNGIDACARLRAMVPSSRVILLTMHADRSYAAEGFRAGAAGYVLKASATSELVQAIRCVLRGQRYLARTLPASVLMEPHQPGEARPGRLTTRQREVLQLIAEGRGAKQIAAVLGISTRRASWTSSTSGAPLSSRATPCSTAWSPPRPARPRRSAGPLGISLVYGRRDRQ
jgi:DNA-binding NarL/FixJ family response regulator